MQVDKVDYSFWNVLYFVDSRVIKKMFPTEFEPWKLRDETNITLTNVPDNDVWFLNDSLSLLATTCQVILLLRKDLWDLISERKGLK